MGQEEVLSYMILLRKAGDHNFKSPKEINEGIVNCNETNTRKAINRLYAYGYLEIININWWIRKYRVKKEHLE